jgi:hydroxymethylbilane synthase
MLVIGSRGSQLALWQANHIKAKLEGRGLPCTIEIIHTRGDKILDVPLAKVGGKGLFTKEIEDALLDGRIHLAVHSLKDLPTQLPEGLVIAAIPERADPLDAIIGSKLRLLRPGAVVGTSSLRRVAQLTRLRPDLDLRNIRGNIDTRISKVEKGEYDAIVLAAAGVRRLGWGDIIAESFRADVMLPAVGQGALAIETLESGPGFDAARLLDDPWVNFAITAERALLAELGGGCQVPIGAFASLENTELFLTGGVFSPDGATMIRYTAAGDCTKPSELGRSVAGVLLQRGAGAILDSVYQSSPEKSQ